MKRLFSGAVVAIFMALLSIPAFAQTNPSLTRQGMVSQGGFSNIGSSIQVGIGTPAAGTATATCSGTCSTTYTYRCVATDNNGVGLADTVNTYDTIPSASFTTTVAGATLSATTFNTVTCGGQIGAVKYKILKADNAHVLGHCFTNSNTSCSIVDNSTAAGSAYTAQTVDQTALQFGSRNACAQQVTVSTGAVIVQPPTGCPVATIVACAAVPAGAGSTPVASNLGNCFPTSTATVLSTGGATITVQAMQVLLAGTATATENVWPLF